MSDPLLIESLFPTAPITPKGQSVAYFTPRSGLKMQVDPKEVTEHKWGSQAVTLSLNGPADKYDLRQIVEFLVAISNKLETP